MLISLCDRQINTQPNTKSSLSIRSIYESDALGLEFIISSEVLFIVLLMYSCKSQELREVLASKEDEREGMGDIEEQLELVTLDKEMAEERAEMLQVVFRITFLTV